MSTRATEAESVLKEHMGYLPVSEMERRGVSRTEISRFVREAKLEKAAKGLYVGSVRPRLTRKACSPKTRLFDCAERSNKRVEISLLQRQIDDSVQMCKQAFF